MLNAINGKSTPAIIIALLFIASAVKGGVIQWASLIWVCLALAFTTILFLTAPPQKLNVKKTIVFFTSPTIISLICFQAWSLFQWNFVSLDINASLYLLFLNIGILVFLFLLFISLESQHSLKTLYVGITSLVFIQALYGIAIYLSQTNKLLWMEKLYYLDRPTGTFVNPNHFAALLLLGLILVSSHIMVRYKQKNKHSFWLTLDFLFDPYLIISVVLVVAILMSKSIGAIVALASIFMCFLTHIGIKQGFSKKASSIALISIIIALLAVLQLDYSLIETEISGLSHTINRRIALSQAGFNMLSDHWLVGVGGGAFYSTFSPYRDLSIGNTYYNFVHNDYLQFWIEYGVIGITCLSAFIFFAIKENIMTLAQSKSTLRRTFAYTSIYASISLAIHSLVDFPLHIFAYALIFLCIISINTFINLLQKSKQ